jgi:hypothetical protein
MCVLPIAPDAAGAAGVTFVDCFSVGGQEAAAVMSDGSSCIEQLQALYAVVERFVRNAAAGDAAAQSPSGACCCFVIDGIHELLMYTVPCPETLIKRNPVTQLLRWHLTTPRPSPPAAARTVDRLPQQHATFTLCDV